MTAASWSSLATTARFATPIPPGHEQVCSPHLGEERPRPRDGLGLEVVAKRPVAEHLKHRVVVAVAADVLEVVVLAAGADALLAVGRPLELAEGRVSVGRAEEDRLVLVHAGIDEEEGGCGRERGVRTSASERERRPKKGEGESESRPSLQHRLLRDSKR